MRITVKVNFPADPHIIPCREVSFDGVEDSWTLSMLQLFIEDQFQVPISEQKLLLNGRTLKNRPDEDITLCALQMKDKDIVYLTKVTQEFKSTSLSLQEASRQQQQPALPPALASMLASHPELLQSMLLNDPQMKAAIDASPDLRHALNDPSTIKEMIDMMTNPRHHAERMRHVDRALLNLETIPDGFLRLNTMWNSMQPAVEALENIDSNAPPPSSSLATAPALINGKSPVTLLSPTSTPMPNPWKQVPTHNPFNHSRNSPFSHHANMASSSYHQSALPMRSNMMSLSNALNHVDVDVDDEEFELENDEGEDTETEEQHEEEDNKNNKGKTT